MTVPADIVNRALDAIGYDEPIGDLQEGTKAAAAALRVYGPTMRQIFRAAHWNFARKQAQLKMLNDATGQTTAKQAAEGWPPTVGIGTPAMGPWTYEYQWPIDGMKARFVPAMPYCVPATPAATSPTSLVDNQGNVLTDEQGNILVDGTIPASGPSNVPLMSGLSAAPIWAGARQVPARFVVAQDNVPPVVGALSSWDQAPDFPAVQGESYGQQTVILTNVKDAMLVYTALIPWPDVWDPLFQQAMVAALGASLAMPCLADKKFAMQMRAQQIAVAKQALTEARIADGDEGWFTVDHTPDWLRARNTGGWGGPWGGAGGGEFGVLGYGWDSCGFADGSAY